MSDTFNQDVFEAAFAEHFGIHAKPLKCDDCGRFIAWDDFGAGATRYLATPDSEFTREEYVTLCRKHAPPPTVKGQ